jgi:DNA-binding MarR family transcriptional regulator
VTIRPAAARPALDLNDSLGYAIKRAQVRTYDAYFRMLGDDEVSPARMTALSIIAMEHDINQATLAQRLNISGPSVVKVIDALEGLGLAERVPVEGDRRRYALVLTDAGRRKLTHYRAKLAEYEERIASGLTRAERRQLMQLLERVAADDGA